MRKDPHVGTQCGSASLENQQHRSIYHLLSRALGEGVTVAQVIDLDIFDVVSVGDVNFVIRLIRAVLVRGRVGCHARACGLQTKVR